MWEVREIHLSRGDALSLSPPPPSAATQKHFARVCGELLVGVGKFENWRRERKREVRVGSTNTKKYRRAAAARRARAATNFLSSVFCRWFSSFRCSRFWLSGDSSGDSLKRGSILFHSETHPYSDEKKISRCEVLRCQTKNSKGNGTSEESPHKLCDNGSLLCSELL